jgi:hypothetical protein
VPSTMDTRKGCFSVMAMSGAAASQKDWDMMFGDVMCVLSLMLFERSRVKS